LKLTTIRLSNFQSFGAEATTIELEEITYILGPNGSGKTAVLEALSRMFSPTAGLRKVRASDFHVPLTGRGAGDVSMWVEADFEIPEAEEEETHAAVPPFFSHMALQEPGGAPRLRVRLTAILDEADEVEDTIEYVLEVDADDEPVRRSTMPSGDRSSIEVHYLPARRDPSEHISYAAGSLLGRILRAADWSAERVVLETLSETITSTLAANGALTSVGAGLTDVWNQLHRGSFFTDPAIAFGSGGFESVLRQLTLRFTPSHAGDTLPFERLSDGQQSLLYISLVLSWRSICRSVLDGTETTLDPDRLRPPVHTILAIEEPENSLSPVYLGRIIKALRAACGEADTQALIATHAPSLLRRAEPESIRFLRLDENRTTSVRTIVLPDNDEEAAKYVREAVEAFPELYFARLIVLGEGDSELVVLPRVLAAAGIVEDDASVAVVPLGGRHVNHFWRLLASLEIPFVTLLDLDAARNQGGWGRVRNALKKVNSVTPGSFPPASIAALPAWDEDVPFPEYGEVVVPPDGDPVKGLEERDVFFSAPLDLDLMMLVAYPDAYGAAESTPTEGQREAVLGPGRRNVHRLDGDLQELFKTYAKKFQRSSKPATHLSALATLSDAELLADLPPVLERLVATVRAKLATIPE
jgi:putative ATP-dependent endonuclease of OLD family